MLVHEFDYAFIPNLLSLLTLFEISLIITDNISNQMFLRVFSFVIFLLKCLDKKKKGFVIHYRYKLIEKILILTNFQKEKKVPTVSI